ncbi:hypothetical protein HanPI659440_Chr13g0519611 [Helianthus annuus]|nr:hypothetical protein HanPI659440_Chr13g0519611 [Helianthus annuus]
MPIIGMGGVGKNTQFKAWVFGFDDFDTFGKSLEEYETSISSDLVTLHQTHHKP